MTLAGEVLLLLLIPEKYSTSGTDVSWWLFPLDPVHLAACAAEYGCADWLIKGGIYPIHDSTRIRQGFRRGGPVRICLFPGCLTPPRQGYEQKGEARDKKRGPDQKVCWFGHGEEDSSSNERAGPSRNQDVPV